MAESRLKRALNPTVIRLGWVSFFADISSEMLYPITPIFFTTVLGASMLSVGCVEGVAEATASLLKAYSGRFSDRIVRRKPFVVWGYTLAAIGKPLIGLAGSWWHVLFARSLDRAGKGIRTAPRDALIADATEPELMGAAFGWHRLMDTLGATIGPLLAVFFLSRHAVTPSEQLRSFYFWALIPGAAAVLFATLVRETPSAPKAHSLRSSLSTPARFRDLPKPFRTYVISWAVFSITNSSDAFLLMKVKSAGFSLSTVILLYCGYNLVYALTSPWLGSLSDQWGRKPVLVSGLLVFAAVYIGFSQAHTLVTFGILFAIYGLYMAATDGVGKALAVDLIPKSLKATGIGVLGGVTGVATVIASVLAGFLWDHFGAGSAFLFGAVGALVAAVILFKVVSVQKGGPVKNFTPQL